MTPNELRIPKIFSEEDKKFNREMIDLARSKPKEKIPSPYFQDRDYDFTSEILDAYREKWLIKFDD